MWKMNIAVFVYKVKTNAKLLDDNATLILSSDWCLSVCIKQNAKDDAGWVAIRADSAGRDYQF